MSLTSSGIKQRARELGFDLVGIARAERHPKLARLREWIAEGRAGEMTYLVDSLDERLDPAVALPGAKSVVSLGVVYNAGGDTATAGDGAAIIARYARGDDYHEVLRSRLTALVRWMADEAGPGFEAFSCVDNGPVQERVFAERAGLGWIGKNTCLISPTHGSWVVLAEVLTSAELDPDPPGVDQCGSCTRCLDACPTGAIPEAYTVDATRCLSYLTIELRGAVEADLREAIGPRVFGCDICQDVCPWNRRASESDDAAWTPRAELAAPRFLDLCRLSDEAWRAVLKGSALRRAGLGRLRRSLAYGATHLPAGEAAAALDALDGHESSSAEPAAGAIRWAREQISRGC